MGTRLILTMLTGLSLCSCLHRTLETDYQTNQSDPSLACDLPAYGIIENSDIMAWLFHKARFIFGRDHITLYDLSPKTILALFLYNPPPSQEKHAECRGT